jgi:CheY-like chemotaxis protein
MDPAQPPSGFEVLVFNTNEDIVDMLRLALGEEGYRVGAQHVVSFKKGETDVLEVLENAKPRLVIYDVAPPYQSNWAFFRLVSATEAGQKVRWLVTTTNVRALTEEAGDAAPDDVIEIWGKPYDVELIVERVKQIAGPPGDEQKPAAKKGRG